MLTPEFINTLIGSGISGVALLLFYRLMSQELRDLKASIDRLTEKIGA